jgi:hypothetical protein
LPLSKIESTLCSFLLPFTYSLIKIIDGEFFYYIWKKKCIFTILSHHPRPYLNANANFLEFKWGFSYFTKIIVKASQNSNHFAIIFHQNPDFRPYAFVNQF